MSRKSPSFNKGDWIVHTYYGVGQIKGVEKKQIGDEKTKYFKVKANNSTFFVPVDNVVNERIRPVASNYMLQKSIKVLKDTPEEFEQDHTLRKRQISELLTNSALVITAQLVRDLTARRKFKGLNDHEETTLIKLAARFMLEWSITQKINLEIAQEKFEALLDEIKAIEPEAAK